MNRIPPRLRNCALVIGITLVLSLVTACTQPEFRPVHDEVTWEGENTGPYEDDPRVQALREYLVQRYAADNALNYSRTEFTDTVTESSRLNAIAVARLAADEPDLRLWQGPPSMAVIEINPLENNFDIVVCQKLAPWWSMSTQRAATSDQIQEESGVFRVTPMGFHKRIYTVTDRNGRWQVDGGALPNEECKPDGEVAVGTFTTPPDLDLLRTATSETVIVADHRDQG